LRKPFRPTRRVKPRCPPSRARGFILSPARTRRRCRAGPYRPAGRERDARRVRFPAGQGAGQP
jgi:hypothetical protein